MSERINVFCINHMNIVVEDFDVSVQHFKELFGAQFATDLPSPEFHACVMALGGGLIEFFVPNAYLLNARYGPFHLGVEYHADLDQVRRVLAQKGIRIVRDIGAAVHTHPADTLGVSFEFYGSSFHNKVWKTLGTTVLPLSYWRDEHPLGATGLKGYSLAVEDIGAGVGFLKSLFDCEQVYDEARPALSAHAIGLKVGDVIIEVLAPMGDGVLREELKRQGQGIRSTLFGVKDLAAAAAYFEERQIKLLPGSAHDRMMLPPAANRGILFEFAV